MGGGNARPVSVRLRGHKRSAVLVVRELRVAVLVKQVPALDDLSVDADGRLSRSGVPLEMSAFCRRAVTTGVRLAQESGGRCVIFTLGPPQAEDVLREALACGADSAVLVSDPCFAGSDTLATARALRAALERSGPFDLVLSGRNSVDADTGQVPAMVAELLDWPLLGGARQLDLAGRGRTATAVLEQENRRIHVTAELPLVVSCAERLCEPAKASPEARQAVPAGAIRRLGQADLGPGPWGEELSRTRVGELRQVSAPRARRVLRATGPDAARRAIEILQQRRSNHARVSKHRPLSAEVPSPPVPGSGFPVVVIEQPGEPRLCREQLGAAAHLAAVLGGQVAVATLETASTEPWSAWGADVRLTYGNPQAASVASAVAGWCGVARPRAVLCPSTMWGREVAARLGVQLDCGVTGDAVELSLAEGHVVAWKPAFGGSMLAAISAVTELHITTIRPGALSLFEPRSPNPITVERLVTPGRYDIVEVEEPTVDDLEALGRATTVVGVGTGVTPDEYILLQPLLAMLDAELAASRKVTDAGWLPHSRQVGITGRSITPDVYVAVGLSGKLNHMIGVRGAKTVLAINSDPAAPVFEHCDVGLVGDWHHVVPDLVAALAAVRRSGSAEAAAILALDDDPIVR